LLHSSREPGELSQCSKHDDSTINIVVVIIIIIIIIIIELVMGRVHPWVGLGEKCEP